MSTPAPRSLSIRQLVLHSVFALSVVSGSSCHTPIIVSTSSAAVGGTIAGVVTGPADAALADRTVTVVNVDTGQRYQTATGRNGSYTLRVPPGKYRLEVQLRENERMADTGAMILMSSGEADIRKDIDVNQSRQ